jgi:hypothetical protein
MVVRRCSSVTGTQRTDCTIPVVRYDQYCHSHETVILCKRNGFFYIGIIAISFSLRRHVPTDTHETEITHTHTHTLSTVVLDGIILDTLHKKKTRANPRYTKMTKVSGIIYFTFILGQPDNQSTTIHMKTTNI